MMMDLFDKKKCYIYLRVSTTIQVDGYSLEAQEAALRKFAEGSNMEVVECYKDAGKADFINKFHIALKECAETEYWIEMLVGSNCIDEKIANQLLQECGIIQRMLVKSITTAKNNKED